MSQGSNTSDLLKQLIETSRKAGKEILKYYDGEIKVFEKEDESPLTKADLASHYAIIDDLKKMTPDTPIISEESGIPEYEERKNWEKFWIVDPLDGTKEFIKKNGEFTVNIALIEGGEPVLGIVYIPAKDVFYFAEKGKGSFKQENEKEPVRIYSEPADKNKPLVLIQSRSHGSDKLDDYLEKEGIEVKDRVRAGSSLKFCLVAEGVADFYPRLNPTMEWDVAAGDCVFRNSAREGQHKSGLTYNKESLKNNGFVIGF